MIILCGPNGCGKSTLGAVLARALDMPYLKFLTPKNPEDAVRNLDTLLAMPDGPLILDRHPMISDRIYAPIMFPGIDPIPWRPEVLEGHTLIYCRVPLGTAIRRHKYCKGDPFYRNEMRVFAEYDALFSTLEHIKYDWTIDTESELIAMLKGLANE